MGIPFIFDTKNMSREASHANEEEIYFLIAAFWTLGQCFISKESIKCVSSFCSLNAISHILTSFFTENTHSLLAKKDNKPEVQRGK